MLFFYIIMCYFIGNLLIGLFISNYKHLNVRESGSGNPGARNMARVAGKRAAIFTFFGDALKGTLSVFLGYWFFSELSLSLIGLFAVVLGHIYPIIFRFKGGKGISTFIGGILFIEPLSAIMILAMFSLFYLIKQSFTLAGLFSLWSLPFFLYFFNGLSLIELITLCLILFLITCAHLKDLKKELR